MAATADRRAIVERALAYPYESPASSFIQVGGRATALPPGGVDLSGRTPLLAYGANAAPTALARKLSADPNPLPVLAAHLRDLDVVHSAHVSPYGAIPATLQSSPGTTAHVFVAYPDSEQLARLAATELNYDLARLPELSLRLDDGGELDESDAFLSKHGCLALGGTEVALAAVRASGRRFPELDQRAVQELVRRDLAPDLDTEEFVLGCLDPELTAARTAALRATARPFAGDVRPS